MFVPLDAGALKLTVAAALPGDATTFVTSPAIPTRIGVVASDGSPLPRLFVGTIRNV